MIGTTPTPLLFLLNKIAAGDDEFGGVGPFQGSMKPLPASAPIYINGITKDEAGTATDGYTVYLLNMDGPTPIVEQTTISAGGGSYSFVVGPGRRFWAVSYISGSPDKAGATSNNLFGV